MTALKDVVVDRHGSTPAYILHFGDNQISLCAGLPYEFTGREIGDHTPVEACTGCILVAKGIATGPLT